MNKSQVEELIRTGREIELKINNNWYSSTYYNDNREKYISFCEFYKDVVDVSSLDELWEKEYLGYKIKDIFLSLSVDSEYIIF